MKYRPEIDGLRALAVLPVIFFHAGFSFFSGGYVGVDVFFVISGYLITTIILTEKEAGKFSFLNFYERRARRILPALTFVILVSVFFAYYIMKPTDLMEFSQSLIAVSLFSSNILFWLKTGYFMTIAELKPLLHTWSLAIEEQYYILFPLFIIFTQRFRKRTVLALLSVIGFASLALAQWGAVDHPGSTFYLLPTRLWEILIGSFVAYFLFYSSWLRSKYLALPTWFYQTLSLVGLMLIMGSIGFFDDKTPFPSVYTLFPTLGTALVILFAYDQTFVKKILSTSVFVGIGLISYSAYLWHQPIFAFARLMSYKTPSNLQMFFLGVFSLLLAYVTWKYIESPFRDKNRFSRENIFRFSIFSLILIIGIGAVGYLNKGFGNRIAQNKMSYAELDLITQPNFGLNKACDYTSLDLLKECQTSDTPEILIWGDSYAMHLIPGILASKPDAKIIQMTKSVCGPILDMAVINSKYPETWAKGCVEFNKSVIDWLKNNPSVHYVVLGSPFTSYLDNKTLFVNNELVAADQTDFESHLETTLEVLSEMGILPVVFYPTPANSEDIGHCLTLNAIYGSEIDCRIELTKYENDQREILQILGRVKQNYHVINIGDVLCHDAYCDTELDGVFIYRDSGHLSVVGSEYLGKKMDFYKLITSK